MLPVNRSVRTVVSPIWSAPVLTDFGVFSLPSMRRKRFIVKFAKAGVE
jgi:hypothetical protein